MPLNRLRAAFAVYGRHVEVMLIIAALLLGGGIGGYMIRSAQMMDVIVMMRADHVAEVERLQANHRESIAAVSRRLDVLADKQDRAADEVDKAAQAVKQAATAAQGAATTAKGAAANAARSVIRERR